MNKMYVVFIRNVALCMAGALLAALAGCAGNSVISRTYNFNQLQRVGVMEFDTRSAELEGVEAIFGAQLLKMGFTVVERARIQQVLEEEKMSAQGYFDPQTTKRLGQILGVDALMFGQTIYYAPERKRAPTTQTYETYTEPVYRNERVRRPDGTYIDVLRQNGYKTHRVASRTGGAYTTTPQVGLVVRLVDVQTAEVVWVGSITSDGLNSIDAAQTAIELLSKDLQKDLKKVLKKGTLQLK